MYTRYSLVLICTVSIVMGAEKLLGQTSIDQAHVTLRSTAIAEQSLTTPAFKSALPSFKARADLVLVPVSVTDGMNRNILGLGKENFQIYENKRLQVVQSCSSEDAPLSIGIVLDTSGSMQNKLDQAREAIGSFVMSANPLDEFFMITFSDTPVEILDFDSSSERIYSELLYTRPQGYTSLLDAVYLAITKMKVAKYSRKAILIVSDGGDNHSHYKERDVRSLAKEANVMIYGIGIYDSYFDTMEERLGPELLDDLSAVTGGRAFVIEDPRDLTDAARKIGIELRSLYMISYSPKDTPGDGKWHKIKVKLMPPKGLRAVRVRAREGYYRTAE